MGAARHPDVDGLGQLEAADAAPWEVGEHLPGALGAV